MTSLRSGVKIGLVKKLLNKYPNTIIILFISLLGLILLLDTFKYNLSNVFPSVIPFFDGLNETMLDLKLFFKDLIN